MAFVVRDARGRSPFWYAVFKSADDRYVKKSTGLTSRSKALELARTLEKASREALQRTLTEARARELLSEVLETVSGESLRVFTVEQWLDQFVRQKRKARADATAARHEQMMREFVEFLGPRARLNIAAITSRDIVAFRDHRQSLGLAASTVNVDIVILSSAFNAALKQGHISVNPCAAVEKLKDNAERKGTFSIEQIRALVKAATGDWRGVILVGFYTGQRIGDCCALRWRDIDLLSDVKVIRFTPRKTGKAVTIAVHEALEDYLVSLPTAKSDDDFVFPSLAQRETSKLSKLFRRIMEAAHIEQRVIRKAGKGGRPVHALSFHSLRHSFSSILANAGISEERRMALVGHASRDMQQRYTHHELETLRDAVAVLPRV